MDDMLNGARLVRVLCGPPILRWDAQWSSVSVCCRKMITTTQRRGYDPDCVDSFTKS